MMMIAVNGFVEIQSIEDGIDLDYICLKWKITGRKYDMCMCRVHGGMNEMANQKNTIDSNRQRMKKQLRKCVRERINI